MCVIEVSVKPISNIEIEYLLNNKVMNEDM